MSAPLTVQGPGGFAPQVAIAFGTLSGTATAVDASNPLPTRATLGGSSAAPLAGSTAVSATLGPFVPDLARPVRLVLSGTWAGSVQLLRSRDGGTTKLGLTYSDGSAAGIWSGNLNAAVAEETVAGATFYLQATLSAGTLNYVLEQ